MVIKLKFKEMLIILAVVLSMLTVLRINALPAGSITLPSGWHQASGAECFDNMGRPFTGHSGWPFISKSGQDCVTSINQFATSINIILSLALLGIIAYTVYHLRSKKKGNHL